MRTRHALWAGAAVVASTAWAISPHFLSASGTVNSDGALVVSFSEAGLGDNVTALYEVTTEATATYQCYNNGNNQPQGQPYQLSAQPLSGSGTFTSGKNGRINGTLDPIGPPDPAPAEAALKCVSGGNKKLCLANVSYSSTWLFDRTYPDQIQVTPDPASRSFPAPTKKNPTPDYCYTSL